MNRLTPGNCVFISAKNSTNIEELKALIYEKAREIHTQRFPYNNFLYQTYDEDISPEPEAALPAPGAENSETSSPAPADNE